MVFWAVATLLFGAANVWMGAEIRFRGKAGLLNNFETDEKAGKFDRAYARRTGMILLAGGAVCLCAGAAALAVNPGWAAALGMLAAVLGLLAAYHVHYRVSARETNEQEAKTAPGN